MSDGQQEPTTESGIGVRAVYRGSDVTDAHPDGISVTLLLLTVGSIAGTDRAIIARNSKASTPQIVIVLDSGAKFVCESDATSTLADADLPSPNSCAFLSRKIVFGIDDGRMFWSAVDDATDISSLDFADAEGNPDGCVRIIEHLQEIWNFGAESIEVWYDEPRTTVKEQLLKRVSKAYDGAVMDVYFTEFVMQ